MHNRAILLADDDESDIEGMKQAFAHLGIKYPLHVVFDGEEAVSYLAGEGPYNDRKTHPFPAMLILDLKMPKKSGWEVLDWLRTAKHLGDLFVVVMTYCGQAEQSRETFEFHGKVCIFNCHLIKPATFENVEMLIHFFESWWKTKG